MPVTTRSQYHRFQTLENTLQFQNTIENPCVLQVILKNLSTKDMVRMKQISKDVRYNEVIKQLKEDEYKQKVNKIVKKVKNYMCHINTMYYSTEKIRIICKMINLLCINIWFVKDHPAFERVVHNQLFRFMEECPVNARQMYYISEKNVQFRTSQRLLQLSKRIICVWDVR